jgi:hypothetical protein
MASILSEALVERQLTGAHAAQIDHVTISRSD